MFAETRPEAIEEMREAADELRAELAGETVTFVVNRNINVSNVCIVGCAFCGFGQGRRSPEAYEHDERGARAAGARGDRVTARARSACSRASTRSGRSRTTCAGCASSRRPRRRWARMLHLHAYSPMEIAHMCDISRPAPARGLRAPRATRASARRRGRRRRFCTTGCANASARTSCRSRAGWRSSRPRTAAGLRSTATVMFGHIEEPWELAEHMRVVRALQERTGGITEFVPLSFIPFQTLLGRTHGVQEISEAENLKHTAVFRLALGRSVRNLQASWVKMGLDAASESLRWGVNDLGGTLMEESISRMAGSYHGTRLDPEQLVGAAHRAGRPAAERTTLYEIRRSYELAAGASVAA